MFCPECQGEYRAGFTRCADCEVPLVERLPMPAEAETAQRCVVFVTSDVNEAALVRSVLEGSGVDASLLDEHFSAMESPLSFAIGGVKVVVPEDQEGRARAVLLEYRGGSGQDPGHGRWTPLSIGDEEEVAEGAGTDRRDDGYEP